MKKSLLVLSMLLAGATIGAVISVNAHGVAKGDMPRAEHREQMMEQKADLLGISVEDLESYRDQGLRLHEVMEEQGITPIYNNGHSSLSSPE